MFRTKSGEKNEELLVALNGMSIPVLNDSNWANGEDQVARTGTGTSFLVSEICFKKVAIDQNIGFRKKGVKFLFGKIVKTC